MKKIFVFLIVLFSLNFNTAYAVNCKEPKDGNEISICLSEEFNIVDKELNRVYQEVLKKYPKYKKKLVESELAWIKFRDFECKFQALSYEGGTEENREYSRTLIKLTKERISDLKYFMSKRG